VSASPPTGAAPAIEAGGLPPAAGWFGKIPALGDFVSRRLPPEFIEPWDEWLSEELFAAREKLGEDWLDSYLKAPIWRFALMPGAIDDRHWFGVLMPSVDRVGRQFPLTFAASFEADLDSLNRWWSALIGVAMRARAPEFDADALESALLAPPGNPYPSEAESPEQRLVPALSAAVPGGSVWWSWRAGAPRDETVWVLDGLPRGEGFLRLICQGPAAAPD
jgi:type VI secretion system protein ImpM